MEKFCDIFSTQHGMEEGDSTNIGTQYICVVLMLLRLGHLPYKILIFSVHFR